MKFFKIMLVLVFMVLNFNIRAEDVGGNEPVVIDVYRSASCGCCSKWVAHLKENQFVVKDNVIDDVQLIKDKYGVPQNMASCHTALVSGYVVEGHVPSSDIRKLLKVKPNVIGVSVPGMPVGTPGMEMGGRKDSYKVVSFDSNKKYKVFSSYKGTE